MAKKKKSALPKGKKEVELEFPDWWSVHQEDPVIIPEDWEVATPLISDRCPRCGKEVPVVTMDGIHRFEYRYFDEPSLQVGDGWLELAKCGCGAKVLLNNGTL